MADKNDLNGHDLSEVIKVAVIDNGIPTGFTREQAQALTGYTTLASFSKSGKLNASTGSDKYGVVLYWEPTDHDNDYNVNNTQTASDGKDHLFIDFTINVQATQLTSEEDSFDELYDIEAPWMGGAADELASITDETNKIVKISSAEQLAAVANAINAGSAYNGYTITLEKDIDLNNIEWTQIAGAGKNITFDGNGKTIINLQISNGHDAGFFKTASGCTVKNVTFNKASVTGVGRIGVAIGHGMCAYADNVTVKNSTIAAVVTNNDDGDKAGAIVGYLSAETNAYVKNCIVDNVTVSGYRDIGGLVGYAAGTGEVSGNNVKNSTIINDQSNNYKNYSTDAEYHANEIIGECTSAITASDNTATDVTIKRIKPVQKGDTPQQTQNNVNNAITNAKAGDIVVLPSTEDGVKLTAIASGVTVMGDGSTKVDATGTLSKADGATFEGLVLNMGTAEYHGFSHSDVTISNCTILGYYKTYGNTTFENVTFRNDTNDSYCLNIYGSEYTTIKNCHFYGTNKNVFIYNESINHNVNVVFENCDFHMTATEDTKSAVMLNSVAGGGFGEYKYIVELNKCSTEGAMNTTEAPDEVGKTNYQGLWGVKHNPHLVKATVTVDGVVKYQK